MNYEVPIKFLRRRYFEKVLDYSAGSFAGSDFWSD